MPPRTQRKGKNNKNLQHPLSIGLLFVRDAPTSKAERVTGKCYKWKGAKRLWNGEHWQKACALAGCSTRALAHASHEGKCSMHSTAKPYACTHEGCDFRCTQQGSLERH